MTELVIEKIDGIFVVKLLLERATLSKAGLIKDTLMENIDLGHRRFIIDCSTVEFMDSTFLGALVVTVKKLNVLKGDLRLVFSNKNSPIWLMFETTRMFNVFKCYLSLDDAVESYSTSE